MVKTKFKFRFLGLDIHARIVGRVFLLFLPHDTPNNKYALLDSLVRKLRKQGVQAELIRMPF